MVPVGTAWPLLRGWPRVVLLGATVALMISHWWALVLTLQGMGMPLFTLKSAQVPWETWLVLPSSWLLLLAVVTRVKVDYDLH